MTCKWSVTMVILSPLTGVVPLPNGRFMAYEWGLTTYKPWDPPSKLPNTL